MNQVFVMNILLQHCIIDPYEPKNRVFVFLQLRARIMMPVWISGA